MKKLITLLLLITISPANDCTNYVNKFKDSLDDIKMAIELKSKDEAKYFVEEAYNCILDLSAICSDNIKREDIKEFRKILNQHKEMVNLIK